jgi:uncharacterized membrane protein (DUF441 family)
MTSDKKPGFWTHLRAGLYNTIIDTAFLQGVAVGSLATIGAIALLKAKK